MQFCRKLRCGSLIHARHYIDSCAVADHLLQFPGGRRQGPESTLVIESVSIGDEERQKLFQRSTVLLKNVRGHFHYEYRRRFTKQGGCAAKHVALESVDIELDQMHLAVGELGQDAVEASRLRRFSLHLAAEMLGVESGFFHQRPT